MGAGPIWITAIDIWYEDDLETGKGFRYENSKTYRWVKIEASVVNLIAGSCVDFNQGDIELDGTTPQVIGQFSGGSSVFAGVLVSAPPAVNMYGWVQIRGPVVLEVLDGTPAAGSPLTRHDASARGLVGIDIPSTEPVDAWKLGDTDTVYLNAPA